MRERDMASGDNRDHDKGMACFSPHDMGKWTGANGNMGTAKCCFG